MKSLEIIDRKTMLYGDVILNKEEAEQIKQDLERLEKLEEERKLLVSGKMILVSTSVIDRIHKMQQDLEVLELIKKKNVDLQIFYAVIKSSYPYEEQIGQYNHYFAKCYHLTKEEFDKLKQWLKENECETKEVK